MNASKFLYNKKFFRILIRNKTKRTCLLPPVRLSCVSEKGWAARQTLDLQLWQSLTVSLGNELKMEHEQPASLSGQQAAVCRPGIDQSWAIILVVGSQEMDAKEDTETVTTKFSSWQCSLHGFSVHIFKTLPWHNTESIETEDSLAAIILRRWTTIAPYILLQYVGTSQLW